MTRTVSFVAVLMLLGAFSPALLAQPVIDVRLSNSGGPAIPYASPALGTARDFQQQDINAGATASIVIYVGNTGNVPLVLSIPVIQGSHPLDFVRDSSGFSNTILPGGYTSFTVAFDPQSVGLKFGQVTFTQNDITQPNPYRFEIRGQGTDTGTVKINTDHIPPNGRVNVDYLPFQFQVSGGLGPFLWAMSSGSLPPGLTLEPAGDVTGLVVANPGVYHFSVFVTDAVGRTDSADFMITVLDPQSGIPPLANVFDRSSANTCSTSAAGGLSLAILALLGGVLLIRRRRSA